jgi:hypothetical protein
MAAASVVQIVALVVAVLSLSWGIGWAVWNYHRIHRPRLIIVPQPAILFGGPGLKFKPLGSKKSVQVKPEGLQQWCVGIRVNNIGPSVITIDHIEASLVQQDRKFKFKQKRVPLLHCWVAVQEDEQLPKVLKPGELWSGLCDYHWLVDRMKETFGDFILPWRLHVRVVDTLGRKYEGVGLITEREFTHIVREHNERGEDT